MKKRRCSAPAGHRREDQRDDCTVRVAGAKLGTLLLGGTCRFYDQVSLDIALGAGVTRDTPDVTARVPFSF